MNSENILVLCLISIDKEKIQNFCFKNTQKSPKIIMTDISISFSGLKNEGGANYKGALNTENTVCVTDGPTGRPKDGLADEGTDKPTDGRTDRSTL